jgi:hypothetical protein
MDIAFSTGPPIAFRLVLQAIRVLFVGEFGLALEQFLITRHRIWGGLNASSAQGDTDQSQHHQKGTGYYQPVGVFHR